MTALWRDVRYALRLFARERAFTAMAVLTLALGLGASTAVYSVVDAVLLRPLPYAPTDRVVQIVQEFGRRGTVGDGTGFLMSATVIRDVFDAWRASTTTLDGLGIFGFRSIALRRPARASQVAGIERLAARILDARHHSCSRAPAPRRRKPARERRRCRARREALALTLRRRSEHCRPHLHARRPLAHNRGRGAGRFRVPGPPRPPSGSRSSRRPRRRRSPEPVSSTRSPRWHGSPRESRWRKRKRKARWPRNACKPHSAISVTRTMSRR